MSDTTDTDLRAMLVSMGIHPDAINIMMLRVGLEAKAWEESKMAKRPKVDVVRQGRTIIEPSNRRDIYVMTPDGVVHLVRSTRRALEIVNAWYREHIGAATNTIGVGEIEWRGGLQPPKEV